jgi:hypothetical protein
MKTISCQLGIPENPVINSLKSIMPPEEREKVYKELKLALANNPTLLDLIVVSFQLTPEKTKKEHQADARQRPIPTNTVAV